MGTHVIVGKGPIGSHLAAHLLAEGHDVRVVSRSGAPAGTPEQQARPEDERAVIHVSADASSAPQIAAATRGADVLYNCVNPPYHRWASLWPPMFTALLDAAEAHGAVLVTAGNLYGYAPGSSPMTEDLPLRPVESKGRVRAWMWEEAKARHDAGRVRATEVRASDYIGPLATTTAHAGDRLVRPILTGRPVRPLGSADQPHSWTYLPDLVRAMAVAGVREDAWGRPWMAPTNAPLTVRELATLYAGAAGRPVPRISPLPAAALGTLGLVSPMLREAYRIRYQVTAPFVMDSTRTEHTFGLAPTPWPQIAEETIAWWRTQDAATASAQAYLRE